MNYKNYNEARKDRLGDIIGDYLSDTDTSSLTFYNDLKDEIKSWTNYHEEQLNKGNAFLDMIDGRKPEHIACDRNDTSEDCRGHWQDFWTDNELSHTLDSLDSIGLYYKSSQGIIPDGTQVSSDQC